MFYVLRSFSRHDKTYIYFVAFFLLVFFFSAVLAYTQNSKNELIDYLDGKESWYGIYVANKKIGYAYDKFNKENLKPDPLFKSTIGFVFKTDVFESYYEENNVFSLLGNQNLLQHEVYEKFIDFDSTGKEITSEITNSKVSVNGNYYVIKTNKNGKKVEHKIPYFSVNLQNYHFDTFVIDSDFAEELGSKIFISGIDLERKKPELSTIQKISQRNILKNGILTPEITIQGTMGVSTDLEINFLANYQGLELIRMEMLGNMTMVPESETNAKDPGDTLQLSDIETFPVDKKIQYQDIKELKLRINGLGVSKMIRENDRQHILSSSIDSVEILLKKAYDISKYKEPNLSAYLESSVLFPLDLPELKKINPIKNENLSALEKGKLLNRFVYDFLDYSVKPMGIELKKLIVERKGDCTEYASLLTALARLNGIPARTVSGYAYSDNNSSPNFGGHAWVELYINEKWREFDPTWNETKLGVEHILMNEGSMLVGGSVEILN